MPFTLPPDADGILPDRMIAAMADAGLILPAYPFVESQIQPASLDLRLGDIAYRVRASFLPGPSSTVAERIDELKLHEIALGDGAPTMGDVVAGCIVEIKSGQAFFAVRGGGLDPPARLSENRDLSRMFWAYGLRGRPVRAMAEVLAELIDAASVGGGTFDLGSATYDMTRIATGQIDAYIEPGPRIVADAKYGLADGSTIFTSMCG